MGRQIFAMADTSHVTLEEEVVDVDKSAAKEKAAPAETADLPAWANLPDESDKPFYLWLINPGAGGQSGAGILKDLRKEYTKHPDHGAAFSLFNEEGFSKPETRDGLFFNWKVLDVFAEIKRPLRVVAAGGDGTVVWIVNAICKHEGMTKRRAEPKGTGDVSWGPVIAVQALGTGNDMSRFLRWGEGLGSASDLDLHDFVKDCDKAEVFQMDRWKVTIDPPPKDTTAFGKKNSTTFMNYFSVGVDGKILVSSRIAVRVVAAASVVLASTSSGMAITGASALLLVTDAAPRLRR